MASCGTCWKGDNLARLSGLEYFSHLVNDSEFRQRGAALYVMPSVESARKNVAWLVSQGIPVDPEQVYIAPMYGDDVADPGFAAAHFRIAPQARGSHRGRRDSGAAGVYIKRSLDYAPAIHCIGAAIAFRSGDQVYIPRIADRLAMGWLLRCVMAPEELCARGTGRRVSWPGCSTVTGPSCLRCSGYRMPTPPNRLPRSPKQL